MGRLVGLVKVGIAMACEVRSGKTRRYDTGRVFFSWHQNENHAAVHGGTLGRLTALEEEFDVDDLRGRI